ncbi:GT2 family glycosyltransferase [Pedobacter sp. UYP30]|uniref:glycosyltransferase n=1 Tax=Pedobacter sp. UYP30 TaxID=1756400 RepID=UPI003391D141
MINLSIVLYNTSEEDIQNIFRSLEVVKSPYKLYIIDNSPTDKLLSFFKDKITVEYIHNPSNPGFGASHNIALKRTLIDNIPHHFVINPDVYFKQDVITEMVEYMSADSDIGMMMPQILNLDGTVQHLPKLLPSPLSIVLRKIKQPMFLYQPFIERYELRNVPNEQVYVAPILSGCFTLFSANALREIGLYDDRFFMYFEDWDISRRMNERFKTVYFPKVSIYHGYESGANKNKKLFKIFVNSAKAYFKKWGWFFDRDRGKINKITLNQFR